MPTNEEGVGENAGQGLAAVNEVRLVGRLSAGSEERELPSGSVLVAFRVIVDRLEPEARERQRVDVLDCVVWTARLRRQALGWRAGDLIEVEGALRRRFFRSSGATQSRVEVEVLRGRVIRRAPLAA